MQIIPELIRFKAPTSGRQVVDCEGRDRNMQTEAIAQLSVETGWRVEDIGPLYRWVFHELEQDAQVHDYLPVLAAKRVKRMLNKRKMSKQPVDPDT